MTEAHVWLARVREFEGTGELLHAYDTALQGLEKFPGDVWLAHRAVLNLAKSGATKRAALEFTRLGLDRSIEADVAALGARIAKDKALAAPAADRADLLSHAADLYEEIYRRSGGYYPAINVATLRLLAGQEPAARSAAREVLELCRATGDPGEDVYYRAASEAEAALILGDVGAAREALVRAASSADLAARAATRRQLRLICDARGSDDTVLAPLSPPAVIHYSGHIIAAPGRGGRFLAEQETEVAAGIKAALDRRHVGFAYGALASGSDILFAEALLARGAELHVVLPFSHDEFLKISVAPAQAQWLERFETCLRGARSVTYATDDEYLGHDALLAYGSFVAMGLAVLRARFLDAEVRQIAVWDGEETTGFAGTGFDVRTWRGLGRETDIIRCTNSAQAKRTPAVSPPPHGSDRELRAMLFGDVKGFSKLTESQTPAFVTHLLGVIGDVLDSYGDDVLYRNTWGDGLFVVLSEAGIAARCALQLQTALDALDLPSYGLPPTLALRIGGHFGPVFKDTDPVLKATNYFGAHVSRTARIEPVTPPGEVYVTEQFAARLALERSGYTCDYVGHIPAAKDYGTLRMYHLHG